MSIVITVMQPNKIIMAGDTQLNNENGPIEETGMKIFPLGQRCLIGITGDYFSYLKAVDDLKNNSTIIDDSINSKIDYIRNIIRPTENNAIITQLDVDGVKFTIMGNLYGYNNPIESVSNDGVVRVLLPPDVSEEFCRPYISALDHLKERVCNCIEAVSEVSDTVNNKICGFELDKIGMHWFCKNVDYDDINIKIKW